MSIDHHPLLATIRLFLPIDRYVRGRPIVIYETGPSPWRGSNLGSLKFMTILLERTICRSCWHDVSARTNLLTSKSRDVISIRQTSHISCCNSMIQWRLLIIEDVHLKLLWETECDLWDKVEPMANIELGFFQNYGFDDIMMHYLW